MDYYQIILDYNNQLYLQQQFYYQQLCNQDNYYKNILDQKDMQKQILISSLIEDNIKDDTIETKITIINDNGKLYAKKILNCIDGMKCINSKCAGYHHPNLESKIDNPESKSE